MHLATSTGYDTYLIMWLPFLFLVVGVGLPSLYCQIRSDRGGEMMWKWQPWTLVITAGIAMTIHCIGLTQLIGAHEDSNPKYWEDGMKIIRFVDMGFYVILGIGILLLVATAVVRSSHTKNQARLDAP